MKTVIFIFLIMAAFYSQARLGETEQQLTNRYGAPIQITTNHDLRTLNFDFGDYWVQSRLRDGKSAVEFTYLKKRDINLDDSTALSIASKIGGFTNWDLTDSSPSQKTYSVKGTALCVQVYTRPGWPQGVMVTTTFELQRSLKTHPTNSISGRF